MLLGAAGSMAPAPGQQLAASLFPSPAGQPASGPGAAAQPGALPPAAAAAVLQQQPNQALSTGEHPFRVWAVKNELELARKICYQQ
jgi:hypothetical protein